MEVKDLLSCLILLTLTRTIMKIDITDLLKESNSLIEDNVIELHPPKDRLVDVSVQMFWTRNVCACGSVHEAPTYGADLLLKQKVERPRMVCGKQYGWIYKHTQYTPIPDFAPYADLPREIETRTIRLRSCIKCVDKLQFLPRKAHD